MIIAPAHEYTSAQVARAILTAQEGESVHILGEFMLDEIFAEIARRKRIERLSLTSLSLYVPCVETIGAAVQSGNIESGHLAIGTVKAAQAVEFAAAILGERFTISRTSSHAKLAVARFADGSTPLAAFGSANLIEERGLPSNATVVASSALAAQVEEAIAASPVIAQQRGLATIDFDFGAL